MGRRRRPCRRSRLTLPAAALLATGGAIARAFARDPTAVMAAVVVLSVGLAGIGPVLDARTVELLGLNRGALWSRACLGLDLVRRLGRALRPAPGCWGTGAPFLVHVPCLALTALIALSVPRQPVSRRASLRVGMSQLVRQPRMARFLLGTLMVLAALAAVNGFYSIQIVALGGDDSLVGLAWVVGALFEIPIMWSFPRLSARFGAGRLLVAGGLLFAGRDALAALAPTGLALMAIAPLEGAAFGLFFVGGSGSWRRVRRPAWRGQTRACSRRRPDWPRSWEPQPQGWSRRP